MNLLLLHDTLVKLTVHAFKRLVPSLIRGLLAHFLRLTLRWLGLNYYRLGD